jgi:hypothetical protein
MGRSVNGVANSVEDSVCADNSVMGVDEGWSENLSDDEGSVHVEKGTAKHLEPRDIANNHSEKVDCSVEQVGSVQQGEKAKETEERVDRVDRVMGTEEDFRSVVVFAGVDGDHGGGKEVILGYGLSAQLEEHQGRDVEVEVVLHQKDNDVLGEDFDNQVGQTKGGPELVDCAIGLPVEENCGPIQIQKLKGKEVIVCNNKQGFPFKGSCSKWAYLGVGSTAYIEEYQEVRHLKNKEVAFLAQSYEMGCLAEKKRNIKDRGCKNWPPLSGPNKWASLINANKGRRGTKKKKGRKSKSKISNRGLTETDEDPIQISDSDSVGESGDLIVQNMIPISNLQLVLNEGELCSVVEGTNTHVRIEAERLFHIGLNLGVTSNEERLQTLERMVILEGGDIQNNVVVRGEEGDQ